MASCPITSWQTEGQKVKVVTDFIYLGSQITAVNASMKLRHLLLGIKAMTNLDSVLKSRHYFDSKCLYSQTYVFANSHVWM